MSNLFQELFDSVFGVWASRVSIEALTIRKQSELTWRAVCFL